MRLSKVVSLSLLVWATSIYALPAEPVPVPHEPVEGGGRPPTIEGDPPSTQDTPPPPPTGDDNTGDNSGVEGGNWQVPDGSHDGTTENPGHNDPTANPGHDDPTENPGHDDPTDDSAVNTLCRRDAGGWCKDANGDDHYTPVSGSTVKRLVDLNSRFRPDEDDDVRSELFTLLRPHLLHGAPPADHGVAYVGPAVKQTEILEEMGLTENVGAAYGGYGRFIFDENSELYKALEAAGLIRRFFEVTSALYMQQQRGDMTCLKNVLQSPPWHMAKGFGGNKVIFNTAERPTLANFNQYIKRILLLRSDAVDLKTDRNGITSLRYPIPADGNPLHTPGHLLIDFGRAFDVARDYKGERLMPAPDGFGKFDGPMQNYRTANPGKEPPLVIFSSWDKYYQKYLDGEDYTPDGPCVFFQTYWRPGMQTEENQPMRNGQNYDRSKPIHVDIFGTNTPSPDQSPPTGNTPPTGNSPPRGNSPSKREPWMLDHAPLAIAAY